MYGWYSAKADESFGHVIYLNDGGKEVKVMNVSLSTECPSYKWDDKVYVGEVTEYLRGSKQHDNFYKKHKPLI